MKKITLMAALLGSAYFANAQVGIGTPTPEEASMLHINADNKGVIIPNVKLTSTGDTSTVVGVEVQSLLVYNTNTVGDSSTTGVVPGFYYWEDSKWQRITTKAELDAAIGNVTNIQNDLEGIKELLDVAYPSNNLDGDTSTTGPGFGGGMIFTPDSGTVGSAEYVPAKIEYVYFDGTSYVNEDITGSLGSVVSANETKTSIITVDNKQYYVSENFVGDTNTIDGPEPGVYLIDVVGGVVNNFSEIIGDSTTVVTINGDTTTIENYFNSLGADSNTVYFNNTADTATVGNVTVPAYTFYLQDASGNAQIINLGDIIKVLETVTYLKEDTSTGIYTYTNEKGETSTINIPNSVINNFETILDGTVTLQNGDTKTVETIIKEIVAEGAGNMTFIPGADSATALSGASFEYIKANGDTETITFDALVKANETVTTLNRKEETSSAGVVITYDYLNEDSQTTTISLTSDIKTLIDGNTDIKNAIQNILKTGGSVYYTADSITADSTTNNVVIPANSFYRIDENGIKHEIKAPNLENNLDGTYTFTALNGDTTTIDIPASIVNNFEQILGDTTTYNNTQLTIKQIIEQIAAEGSGNMTFIPGADSSTLLSEAKFQYLDTATNTIVTKTFKELIQANETLTSLTGDTNTGVIKYRAENELEEIVDIKAMVIANLNTIITAPTTIDSSTNVTLVDYIQNMIDSSTVNSGNVFYGNVDSSTNVLYTQEGDSKTVIDVVSTLIENTTGSDSTTIENVNKLKVNLGDKFDSTTATQIIKTGDTWNDGKAIYKGIYNAYIVGKTALVTSGVSDSPTSVATTNAISLEKTNVGDIISITVLNVDGSKITTSTTDVSVSSNALKFSIGTGNMYNVLFPQATSNTAIKVLVEFSAD